MLKNFIDPIPSLQDVKNQANQFKRQTVTALTYEQYSELLLSDEITHAKQFKCKTEFGSKYRRSLYEI